MFALYMNPVTANAELYVPVAMADTKEKLEEFLGAEKVEPYSDGTYRRNYREGPLHNYNPPQLNGFNCFGKQEGIVEVVSLEDLIRQHENEQDMWASHFNNTKRL